MVVEDGTLDVVGGSRRATVLRMLQGIWGHATVRAPCHLFAPTDPKVASRFRAKDTQTNGTGILFHGRQQEAWHMGKPLFRCAQEWCDCLNEPVPQDSSSIEADAGTVPNRSLDACGPVNCEAGHLDMPLKKAGTTYSAGNEQNDSCQDTLPAIPKFMQPQVEAEFSTSIRKTERVESFELEAQPSAQSKDSQEGSAAVHGMDTVVCCMWLQGKCWKQGNHRHGRKLFLHEDVPGMACGFGDQCLYQHYKYRVVPNADTAEGSSTAQVPHGQSCVETGHETLDPRVLQVGMVVFMASLWSEFGEVIEISHDSIKAAAPIKVCDVWSRKTAWFSIDSLQVPDYSSLSPGLRVTVICEDKNFLCEILQISDEVSRARAPVHVSYNGYTKADAEWVGADRLRSKALKYVHPRFPSEFQEHALSSRNSQDCGLLVNCKNAFVCCMWLEGRCNWKGEHWLGQRRFLHEDVPGMACGFGDQCLYQHYKYRVVPNADTAEGSSSTQVPRGQSCVETGHETLDPRVLQVGMVVFMASLWSEFGEVIEISHDSIKAAAPIKVCDVWSRKTAWFSIDSLQVPDYSSLSPGLRVTVICEDKNFLCEILQISDEVSRARAPVHVSYNGYTKADAEWVGADRLRSKALKYVHPRFPSEFQVDAGPKAHSRASDHGGAAVATREETFVCCLWLEGKCWHECEHWLGKKLFLHEDVPGLACGFGDKCTYLHHKNRRIPARDTTEGLVWKPLLCDESCADASAESLHHLVLQVGMLVFFHSGPKPECGKVIEISHDSNEAAAPIKVCGVWSQKTAWFAIDRLQVPDYYSSLELGMRVNVVCKDRSYVCKIIEISYEVSRASAPVRVSYHGSTSAEDEWVGADRLRAKALKYVQPRFPSRLQLETQPAMQISSAENCGLPLPGKNLQSSDTSLAAFEFPASARPEQFVHTESTNQVHSGGEAVIAPAFRSCDSLPWHAEIDEDAIILDRAIEAVAMALKEEGQGGPRQRLLEQALGPLAASSLVGCVLAQHGWTGSHFSLAPELQKLYDHLVKTRSDLFEGGSSCAGVDYDSDAELPAEASEVFLEVENDAASSCAMQADSLDEIIDRQQNTINKLTGTLICGTFRCVAASSEGKLKHCGEVIVERGPAPLLGCKVRIPAGKSRGNAWDCDRCYVRILVAAVSVL